MDGPSEVFNTQEFLNLKKIWDKKLEESGFIDIEKSSTANKFSDPTQKSFLSRYERRASNEEYYSASRAFLYECRFAVPLHAKMWEMHAEGIGYRTIAAKIGKFSRFIVHKWIDRYRRLMLAGVFEYQRGWCNEARKEVYGYRKARRGRTTTSRTTGRGNRCLDRRACKKNDGNSQAAN